MNSKQNYVESEGFTGIFVCNLWQIKLNYDIIIFSYNNMPRTSMKKKVYKKKSRHFGGYRRKRYAKVVKPVDVLNDQTVVHLNQSKPSVARMVKQIALNSFNYTNIAVAANVNFDPSGGFGAFPAVADWPSCKTLYDQYKLVKIKCTFRLSDTSSSVNPWTMYIRYNYDPSFGTPSTTSMSLLPQVVQKTFTRDSPSYEYTVYPRMQLIADAPATLASQGLVPVKSKFIDVDYPVPFLGLLYVGTAALSATQTLYVDVSYTLDFKYQV